MNHSLRLFAAWVVVAAVVWFFGYMFDRHMIYLIKKALNEREAEADR